MIPADLERRILEAKQKVTRCRRLETQHIDSYGTCLTLGPPQGFVPFFVSATAGTTVYGAFDPLIAISDICRKYSVWMHVDVSESPFCFCNVNLHKQLLSPHLRKRKRTISRDLQRRNASRGRSSPPSLTNLLCPSRLRLLCG